MVQDEEQDSFELSVDLGDADKFMICDSESFEGTHFLECTVAPDHDADDSTFFVKITII